MIKNNKILIIGTLPPPVGGVSIHTYRMLEYLKKVKYPYEQVSFKSDNFLKIYKSFLRSKTIHLHISRSKFRLVIVLLCRVLKKNIIITIHGNLGRFGWLDNLLDKLSIRLATVPIVMNKSSYNNKAKLWNRNCRYISSYIPDPNPIILDKDIKDQVNELRKEYSKVFLTYAPHRVFDKKGRDIYQIDLLWNIFKNFKKAALIVLDPSGEYTKYYANELRLVKNILIINKTVNLTAVAKLTDVFLRITTTDGDSLSLKEVLAIGKDAIATKVVDRPAGCILVEDTYTALKNKIINIRPKDNPRLTFKNSAEEILELYKEFAK